MASSFRRSSAHRSFNVRTLCKQNTRRLGAMRGEVLSENAAHFVLSLGTGVAAAHVCVEA